MDFLIFLLALPFAPIILVLFAILLRFSPPTAASTTRRSLRVAFVHPDLGIGGAERLVVDAAVGLQGAGHRVVMFTSHHDPTSRNSLEETRDGTLKVVVHGDALPRSIFGRFKAFCAYLRNVRACTMPRLLLLRTAQARQIVLA